MAQLQDSAITGSLRVSGSSPAGIISSSNNITTAGNLYANGTELQTNSTSFAILTKNVQTVNFANASSINIGNSAATTATNLKSAVKIEGPLTASQTLVVSGSTILGDGFSSDTTTINGNLIVNGTISSNSNLNFGSNNLTASNLKVNNNTVLGGLSTNTVQITGNLLLNNDLLVNGNTTLGNATTDIISCAAKIVASNTEIRNIRTTINTNDRIYLGGEDASIMTIAKVVGTEGIVNRVGINNNDPRSKLHIKQSSQGSFGGIRLSRSDANNNWAIWLGDYSVNSKTNVLNFSYGTALDGTGNSIKGYLSNDPLIVGSLNFTGQHRNRSNKIIQQNNIGMIVVSDGMYQNIDGFTSININEALPIVSLSSKRNQKNVFGVISNLEDTNSDTRTYELGIFVTVFEKQPDDNRLIINSLGEGGIWVCNINGNLENGDYITTCEIPGFGMKQDDDLLHNYTVAKITCDCDFDLNSAIYMCEEFQFEGKTYRKAFVGCTYHCG